MKRGEEKHRNARRGEEDKRGNRETYFWEVMCTCVCEGNCQSSVRLRVFAAHYRTTTKVGEVSREEKTEERKMLVKR